MRESKGVSVNAHRRKTGKWYEGKRSSTGESFVTVDGRALDPRFDLRFHSPDGFEWGYGGSGPAQLALAILADYLGDDQEAERLHQEFKGEVVSGLTGDSWTLTGEQIGKAIDRLMSRI
jgi:hypothetical protein